MRGVPLDGSAQELRRGKGPLRHHLGGDQRRLRGLSRPRIASRCLGRRAAELVAVRKERRPEHGTLVRFTERRDVTWSPDAATGTAARSRAAQPLRAEVETCGLCHGRRGQLSEAWVPGRSLSDTHLVSLLGRGLYHADGQMLDEVYNYGSFRQSKMFAAGVTCSDCHEPHSMKLRAAADGVCLQCHAPDKYAAASHHRHERPTRRRLARRATCRPHLHGRRPAARPQLPHPASRSVAETRHAQRLQRLSRRQDCRVGGVGDRALAWARSQRLPDLRASVPCCMEWRRGSGKAAWRDRCRIATCRRSRARVHSTELGSHLSPSNLDLARAGLVDPDPMVRIGALDMLESATRTGFGRWSRRCSPIPSAACASGCFRCLRRADGRAAERGPRAVRARRGRIRRRPTPECRSTRSAHDIGEFSRATGPQRRKPRPNTRRRCGSARTSRRRR